MAPRGATPHADRPNWQPATTFDEYLANCREGLEEWSERRAAKLYGVSRAELWRWKLMAAIPEDRFERLLQADRAAGVEPSTTHLAAVGRALIEGPLEDEVECCPHCGGVLRFRSRVPRHLAKVVVEWMGEQA